MTVTDEKKITEAIAIDICDYTEEMAADIAAMWNTWDDLWPGGFTQGVPYTAERVKKQFGKSDALAILIAIDQVSKKPMGSCTLYAHWRDQEAAYVGTLGVSPEALGKKVGKKLLLESIQRALEKGYTRVDLNTWAGNMKAVPLYKKIGMMWNPEISGVNMEDYVPGILKHPLCSPFFGPLGSNGGWYDAHVREPVQAPDEFEHKGLTVFPYEFAHNENSLSVIVDRIGRGITAIDRSVENKRLRVEATVNSHQVLCGLPYVYTLEIENGSEEVLDLSIKLSGFKGLHFDSSSEVSQKVAPGDTFTWEVPYHLDSTTELFRDGVKGSNILTNLDIDGVKSELQTGLRIKPAVDLMTRWGECRITAGGTASIPLTIVSNLSEDAIAKVVLDDMDVPIKVENENGDVGLIPEGLGGTILNISTGDDLEEGAHDLWVSFELTPKKGQTLTTRKFRVPIYCLGKNGIAVGHDDKQRRLIVATPNYNATFAKEGAILRIRDSYGSDVGGFDVRSSIGPPFGINPFRFAERESSFSATTSETVLAMKANHPDRPLLIEDRATFEHGTGLIRHEVWATNTSKESETFQLRLTGRGGGISFNRGTMYVPMTGGIVKETMGNFYNAYPAVSSEPSDYDEGWVAAEFNSKVVGQFWDMDSVEEFRLGDGQMGLIGFPMVTLEPGETRRISQLWFVFGVQDWTDVQRQWKVHVKKEYETRVDSLRTQDIRNLANLDIDSMIIPSIDNVESNISISKVTLAPLMGKLNVKAPEGWTATVEVPGPEKSETVEGTLTSSDIQLMQDSSYNLTLKPGSAVTDSFQIHRGSVEFVTDWSLNKQLTLIQLGSSGKKVEVMEDVDQGAKVFRVNNGLIEFTASPDYGGCLISLKNEKGVEFLMSAFPNPAPKPGSFFDNYYGGVQPIVFDDEMGEDLDKARTNKESMTAKTFESDLWRGVEISWIGKIQKLTRGVHFKLRYLTTPGSPIVLIQWVVSNKTSAPIKFWPSLFVDPKMDEQLAGGTVVTEWNGGESTTRKGPVPIAVTPSRNVLWIKPPEGQEDTNGFGFMLANDTARILSATLGEVLLLGAVEGTHWLKPSEERTITGCLLADPNSLHDIRDLQDALHKIV
ncbi:MAG: GNAT family N-acetyltransferase [Candidatus Thorarchaeota archaeon]